jgi:hypothetical protein
MLIADYINIFLTYDSIQSKRMFVIFRIIKHQLKNSGTDSPEHFKIAVEFSYPSEKAGRISPG